MRELTGKKVYINDVLACCILDSKIDFFWYYQPCNFILWPNCSVKVLPARSASYAFVKHSDYIYGEFKVEEKFLPNAKVISLSNGVYFQLTYHKRNNLEFELDYPLNDIYILNREQVSCDLELFFEKAFNVKNIKNDLNWYPYRDITDSWRKEKFERYSILYEIEMLLLEKREV